MYVVFMRRYEINLARLTNYAREKPIRIGAAAGGLAGLLGSIGIVAADPTAMSLKYTIRYLVTAPLILAGIAALSVWLAQGIETHRHKI